MRILVTGGAGFIGTNFVNYWSTWHNDEIRVIDSLTYAGNRKNLAGLDVDFRHADINDTHNVIEAMRNVDVVVHFAAESHVDRSRFNPEGFYKTNVEGTQNLLRCALAAGVHRFHHVSTDEVFGALPLDSKEKFSETTPYNPNPNNKYAVSKAEADFLVREFQRNHEDEIFITISNCSNNFGPFHYPEKFIPLAITNLIDGLPIPLYGDGLYTRDWLETTDHAYAIDKILQYGKKGETYMIGANCEIPNIVVAKTILKLMGKDEREFKYVPDRPSHDRRYAVDSTKLRSLGWKPAVTQDNFAAALQHTIDWYRQNESWWRPLLDKEGPVYDAEGNLKGHIKINREFGGVKFTELTSGVERK